jgi:amino acid transporter
MSDTSYDDDYEEGYEPRDLQKLLLKSFLIVIFCYTLYMTGMAIITGVVFYEFFRAAADLEPEAFNQALAEDSANLFKRSRYLPFVALSTIFCFALGWLVVRLAPFSRMVHAVILVLLVAATMFVFATGEETPAELQTVAMIMVAFGPIALVIGARISQGGQDIRASVESDKESL